MRKERGFAKKVLALCLAGAVAAGFAGCAQEAQTTGKQGAPQDKVYQIGITQYADHPSLDNCREGFLKGLEESGLQVGKDVEVDFKAAQGDMAMVTQIAQNFASSGKDLVCGIATPSAQSLYAACLEKNIPVIFNAVSDPVEAKLAVSQTQPMKGVTGISDELPVEDQLKMIREILPEAKKIGILYTTSEANSVSTLRTYQQLAPAYGFEIVDKGIAKQAEVPQALDVLLPQVDCISNMTDNTVVSALGVLLEKANGAKVPVFGSEEEQVKNGCLASAGLDYILLGRQAGRIAARVLKGEDVSAIAYEKLKETKYTANEATAQSLGITLPDSLLARADKVK